MARYNRKKRNIWFQEQQALRQENLKIALRADGQGAATDEQMLLINQYKAIQEAEETRLKKRGALGKSMDWLFPGVKSKHQEANILGVISATVDDELFKATGSLPSSASEAQLNEPYASLEMANLEKASAAEPVGGPLDRQANKLTEAAEKTTKSWTSWLTTR
jgi:hypothetical protein